MWTVLTQSQIGNLLIVSTRIVSCEKHHLEVAMYVQNRFRTDHNKTKVTFKQ